MKKLLLLTVIYLSFSQINTFAQTWSPCGDGPGAYPFALTVFNNELYVAGSFIFVEGVNITRVAKWNGSTWSAVNNNTPQTQISNTVNASLVYNGNYYIGGSFGAAGGISASRVAKWNGSAWSAVGSGVTASLGAEVYSMAEYNGDLYVGGFFTTAGSTTVGNIAKWSGSAWSAVGSGSGFSYNVEALCVYNSELYAAGSFDELDGNSMDHIAKWNGSSWSAVGTGLDGDVSSMAVFDGELYVGGNFNTAGGTAAENIAKWNGSAWSAVGTGANSSVLALFADANNLYAGGSFSQAGGTTVNNIAKWNGSAWSAIGSGVSGGSVNAIASYNNYLYIAGAFDQAGGNDANRIARWGAPLAVGELDANSFQLYPNPATNTVSIESELQKCKYELSDLSGKLIFTGSANTQKFELDLSGFESGVYLLTLFNEEKVGRMKIVKQ